MASRLILKIIAVTASILFLGAGHSLSAPVLHFSDITSGPATGNTDGAGGLTNADHGCIVTLWGVRMGAAQDTSQVFIRDSNGQVHTAAHVYYWKNADGTLPGGPADLFIYHKMQEVAFSLPSAAADGPASIFVRVGGTDSNTLAFTVRDGRVLFVKPSGDDTTGDGSWNTPWQTLDYSTGAGGKTAQGDCVYATTGVQNGELFSMRYNANSGTQTHPVSFSVYPGARVTVSEIGFWRAPPYPEYCHFSKFNVDTTGTGIASIKGMRAVGNNITGPDASGQSGAISGGADGTDGVYCLGNHIHNFGRNDYAIRLHHVFYLSNRDGTPNEAYELGWNYLNGNHARGGLHIYDEGACGDFTGVMKIHDNVVVNQSGACFAANGSGDGHDGNGCITVPMDVYNNLFINCSQPPFDDAAIRVAMSGNKSHIRFYNNTLYGWSYAGSHVPGVYVYDQGSSMWNFQGSFEWLNNIVVDTNDLPFSEPIYFKTPSVSTNNIWYDGGNGQPVSAPVWDTAWDDQMADPLFANAAGGDFSLNTDSPAVDSGTAQAAPVVSRSLLGIPRPQQGGYDIGAFEHTDGTINQTNTTPPSESESSGSGGCFLTVILP